MGLMRWHVVVVALWSCGGSVFAFRPAGRGGVSLASLRRGPCVVGAYAAPPPELSLPGDTLEELPAHVAYTASCAGLCAFVAWRALAVLPLWAWLASVGFGLFLAELFSGVFHWATDNYGSLETPVFGAACAAFQGHHKAPWTITYRGTCNNVYKIARGVAALVAAAYATLPPCASCGVAVMLFGQVLAQEAHKWSHVPPSEQPGVVRLLQRRGLALSVREHGLHHSSPYAGHYCILSGALNPALDDSGFFRKLEKFVYDRTGVEPNCWTDGHRGAAVKARALGLPPPPPPPSRAVRVLDDAAASDLEPYLVAA